MFKKLTEDNYISNKAMPYRQLGSITASSNLMVYYNFKEGSYDDVNHVIFNQAYLYNANINMGDMDGVLINTLIYHDGEPGVEDYGFFSGTNSGIELSFISDAINEDFITVIMKVRGESIGKMFCGFQNYDIWYANSTNLGINTFNGSCYGVNPPSDLLGNWYEICFVLPDLTVRSKTDFKCFFNGTLFPNVNDSNPANNGFQVDFGIMRAKSDTSYNMKGRLYDVKIYKGDVSDLIYGT